MQDENNDENKIENEDKKSASKTYFYIAVTAAALSVVAFGLSFTVLGIYALISSVILNLAALAFLNTQKKLNNFKAVFTLKVIVYALLLAVIAFFVGGLIYSAV